jgi:hypothetical protein
MKVNLYIYVDSIVSDFTLLTCDSTLISCDSTEITADQTQTQQQTTARIARKIDLFNDEKISVTSSIQNINDISKVFTDYSQSFTIPASKNNNQIFKHWYENAIDNGFNQLTRYDGFIEIDTKIFRVGKWQLESASIKQNKIEDYKLTFYGNLLSLTDRFGDDKLQDLTTLNDYTIEYSGDNVKSLIQTTSDEDVLFPLISSNRVWQFGGGGANDISSSSNPIVFNELAPAIKISRVLNAIESKYGVTFNGNFLTQSRFDKAFLWLKNKEIFSQLSAPSRINFIGTPYQFNEGGFVDFDLTNDVYYSSLIPQMTYPICKLQLSLTTSCNWIINFYKSGALYYTMTGNGSSIDINAIAEEWDGQSLIPYYMTIQTSIPVNYSGTFYSEWQGYDTYNNSFIQNFTSIAVGGITGATLDLTKYAPDMKVADFISGILKMFNLTAFSENETDYTFEQLENWYYQGAIKNFTQYTTTDLEFERIKAYKSIIFEFEKSESFMNRAFYDNAGREYANLKYQFNIDGSDFNIKLPFETLLFNKFSSNNLQVAYSIDKKFAPYITKPVILYKLDNVNIGADFYFNTGSTTSAISNYNVFGQDVYYNGQTHSLNFGQEISSYFLDSIPNSLFADYYFNYLSNLYSLKSRLVKVKMRLPYNELLNLKLNDRIVIRDKRYIINQFTTDLTTFEVSMELIQDFRSINFPNVTGRTISSDAQTLRFDYVANEVLIWEVLNDPDGQIISIDTFDTYVEVQTKENVSGFDQIYSITNQNNDLIVITQNG